LGKKDSYSLDLKRVPNAAGFFHPEMPLLGVFACFVPSFGATLGSQQHIFNRAPKTNMSTIGPSKMPILPNFVNGHSLEAHLWFRYERSY